MSISLFDTSLIQSPMPTALTHLRPLISPFFLPSKPLQLSPSISIYTPFSSSSTLVHQLDDNKCDPQSFSFDDSCFDSLELKKFETPCVEVGELEDIPDQWRRSRLAWLCKELPAHKTPTMVRILNAQRKWFRQQDGTYIAVHCMRIRENDAAFRFVFELDLSELDNNPFNYLLPYPFRRPFPHLPLYQETQLNNNNIPSVVPQVGSRKGSVYADLTPTFTDIEAEETQLDVDKCDPQSFNFDDSCFDSTKLKKFEIPAIEVSEIEDIPDRWRRSRFAWLCKELPARKTPTIVRILNAQRKWFRQQDGTYIAVHCMRIRENEADFRKFETPCIEVGELEDILDQWRRPRLAWLCKELSAHKTPTMVRILNARKKWLRQQDGTYIDVHCMRIRENEAAFRVSDLEDISDQWRRSRLTWLCKKLPAHKTPTMVRILTAQWKLLRQEDGTYIAVHWMCVLENEAAFRVYKWMMQQHWFRFDFALATKLADYLGKERKHLKCREIFDDIINQGRVPCESTFHILIVAYLSSPGPLVLDEACSIYNRMVHLGGYKPRLNLHNSLFKALLGKREGSSKHFLKQAEFIYQNLTSSGLEIHKDIFGGLIWLHSYQDVVDMERIDVLRAEMGSRGIKESKEVLVSVLRACSKEGNVEEAEKTWSRLVSPPSQAFVYRMEVYAKIGKPTKSFEVFRRMQEQLESTSVAAYHKIIEVLSKYQKLDLADSIMSEFINSDTKQLIPSFIDLMGMYSVAGLHEKLESTFLQYREVCPPNLTIFNIYLDSLVHTGNLKPAEEIFKEMRSDVAIGVNSRSCNSILRGYLTSGEYVKAEKIYNLMRQKKYEIEIESSLMEKLDYFLSLREKVVEEPIRPKLTPEQREVLTALLLGGLQIIRSDGKKRLHAIHFEFNEELKVHSILKGHIHAKFHEWLGSQDDVLSSFTTISHSYFTFYADQFWPDGRPCIPKLIHRWLSPRVLAYWYMYGGYRTSSGDILLRVKGSPEGVVSIVKSLKVKSLDCQVKKRGRVFWIGFLGDNATFFWKMVEPFILDELKELLKAGGNLDGSLGLEFDKKNSDYSDADTL